MNTRLFRVANLLAILLILLAVAGCRRGVEIGELQTKSESVESGDVASVQVEIELAAGELVVSGGAAELLEADFTYNVAEMEPEVNYGGDNLTITHPEVRIVGALADRDDYRNEWDLRFNDDVPMEMLVNLAAGRSDLTLGSLAVTSLGMKAGAGDVSVHLTGVPSLAQLDFEMGAGTLLMDLTGDWTDDLNADITGGVGEMTLRLPGSVGVRVDVEGGIGSVNASNLAKDGDSYTNEAYGESEVTLQFNITSAVGKINLEAEPAPAAAEAAPAAEAPADEEETQEEEVAVFDEELAAQLQAVLEAAVASPDTNYPGVVLHVNSPELGSWSGAAGLGQVETSTPMRPHDKFRAGSLTKPFISVVILQLVEEGLFSLDDPTTAVLPESITNKFANSDQITVRMLLNHTGGLPDFMNLAGPEIVADLTKVWEEEEFLDFAAAQEPWFAPGEAQGYSNTDYTLLGMIIEEATGQSWREEMRQRIFEPLNLENTLLPEPDDVTIPGDHAHGYSDFGAGIVDATELANASVVGAPGGQALVTNAEDLARFVTAVAAGELFQEAGTMGEMLTFVDWPDGNPLSPYVDAYGLGLMQAPFGSGIEGVGHSGDTEGGYHGFVFYLPAQDMTISGGVNTPDERAGFLLVPRALEVLVPGYSAPEQPAQAGAGAEQPDLGAALQGLLDDQVQEQGILGLAMAMQLADGTVVGGGSGYSDPAENEAWGVDTQTLAGSVTKLFTAAVIMQLVEEGKLSLDDTIDTWFPDQPNAEEITVRMLLSHNSGIARYVTIPEVREKAAEVWAPMDLVTEANKAGPVGEPGGSEGHYSNANFILLALIAEEITGNSWDQEVESRIIDALDLKDTLYPGAEGFPDTVVGGYTRIEAGYENQLGTEHPSFGWSAGALVSTVSDLTTFTSALFNGDLFKSEETLNQMLEPLVPVDLGGGFVVQYGLGPARADVDGGPIWGHAGDAIGYAAFAGYDPATGSVVAAAVNTHGGDVLGPSIAALQYLRSVQPGSQDPAESGNVYQDPEGRFSITLVGDWTPLETDGTYVQVAYADAPLVLSLVTVETDDLEGGVDVALRQVGLDPAALTETDRGAWDKWGSIFYTMGDGQGVGVLGQTSDGTSYYFVATGPEDLTHNPPEDALETIQGFSLSGAEGSLPSSVEAFESYVNSFAGIRPPGLSMAIGLGEDVIYEQGFGMADGPREMAATSDTVYHWASVTKAVTAVAIMQLREQGLIDLDAPISDYLDYFPAEYPITVRHLLTHSSGLPEPADFLMVNLRLEGQPLPDFDTVDREFYEGVSNLMFEPGSQSAYVNPDYVTLGQVVAAVSGQPYVEYVQEHILEPLGMTNTDFTYSNEFMEANAAGAAVPVAEAEALVPLMDEARGLGDGADFFRETDENYAWMNHYIVGESAGGGLMGPPTEMIRFGQMMLNEGELDGVRLLTPESVALFQEVQSANSGEPLGIGLAWHFGEDDVHPYIEHDGGGAGIQTKLRLYMKDGIALAIMANGAGFDRNELADAAANVVFSTMGQ
jgi:D-alanyl-D-alanine carboxypeptidase